MKQSIRDYLYSRIEYDTFGGCWLWSGALFDSGYGMATIDRRPQRAHRVSWEITNGEIPPHICVLHCCDIKCCINPNHLFLGSNKDNTRDMISKNRAGFFGENNGGGGKLTWEDVEEIRAINGMRQVDIGALYGISQGMVGFIRRGEVWRRKN